MINQQRIQKELEKHDLEAALLTSPQNLVYLSGVPLVDEESRKWTGLRNAALVRRTGEITLILGQSSEHQVRRDSTVSDLRVYPWRPGSTPAAGIIKLLKDWGISEGCLGIEAEHLPVQLHQAVADAFPALNLIDCAALFAGARAIKTPGELDRLRRAITATEAALMAAFSASRVGDSERDVARRIVDNLYLQGVDSVSHLWVYAGDQTTDKFRPPGDKRLAVEDLVRVDVGASFKGYKSDVARMGIVGRPKSSQAGIYQALKQAEQRMIDAVRPGVRAGELIQVFAESCAQNGLPFSGSGLLTHSIGVVTHDYPVIYEPTDDTLLEAGMVLAIEPYVVVENEKYAVEDDVLVTENGVEILSNLMNTQTMWPIDSDRPG